MNVEVWFVPIFLLMYSGHGQRRLYSATAKSFFYSIHKCGITTKKGGIFIAAFSFPIVATVYWVMGKYSAVFLSLSP